MSDVGAFRNFKPPGPVAAAFLSDLSSTVRTIRGPIGSGKTVACTFDGLNRSSRTAPVCKDGQIHFKLAVAGVTYGQLERNLYPTWTYWLPRDGGNWTEGEFDGGGGRYAVHKLRWKVPRDGRHVIVNFEAIFAAIGELSVEQFVRGFEPSAWYLYEMDQMPEGIAEEARGRLGRFPNRDMLPDGVEWPGYVIGDLNAPDIDCWYYRLAEEVRPPGFRQYVQPGGLSPNAENLHNLPKGYYQERAAANAHKPRWVTRFIHNQYGPTGDGQPVFDLYADERHLAPDDLQPLPNHPLQLGFDQGLTQPACTISQRSRRTGQKRVLAEVLPGRMGARRFAEKVREEIAAVAPGVPIESAYVDPAGLTGADTEAGELAWAEIVASELGITILPAPTNEIAIRLEAVEEELAGTIEAGSSRLLISRRCRQLRKAFASEYKYEGRPVTKSQDRKPIKNLYANIMDALQYDLLGEKGRYGVIAGTGRNRGMPRGSSGNTKIKSDFLGGDW